MRHTYVGVEFTHDERHPKAQVLVSTRAGKIKKWTESMRPTVIGGLLRERVGLRLPIGFRFQKDMIKETMSKHKSYSWTDAKFFLAKTFAIGIYRPYEEQPKPVPTKVEEAPVPAEN